MKPLRLIFSGGGTGGHIFPAIAIANAVKEKVPHAEIRFVGALGRMEMEKVPAAGYPIDGIPIAGLQRKFSLQNLKLPFLILKSMLRSRSILKQFKPHAVVGTGGYASGPLLRAAAALNIPILIQEQNSYAGITNRILSKKAKRICVAYEGMENYFPADRIRLTGNPVRKDVLNIEGKAKEARTFFKLDQSKPVLLVIGGSLGAKAINESIGAQLNRFVEHQIQVLWQCGKPYHPLALKQAETFRDKGIAVFDFINRMDLAYAAADAVVSRAGAGAISELCLLKKACILVPLPTAAEDHQSRNAMALVNKQAALLVKDAECREHLVEKAISLIGNAGQRLSLSEHISALALPDAAEKIAGEVLDLVSFQAR